MAKRILGIDVGHDTLKLALVNGKTVEKVAIEPIPLNLIQNNRVVSEESMGEFLRETMKKNGIRCGLAAYVFQNENIYSRTIKMPKMTPEQLRVNLPYEFADFISDEPQKYVYDYAMLPGEEPAGNSAPVSDVPPDLAPDLNAVPDANAAPEDQDTMSLMAVAVQKEILESVRRFLKKAGLKLVKAAPTMSAYISLIRANGDPEREYCVLDLGHRAIRMHIFKGERYEVTRTLDVGLSVLDDVIAENLNVDAHLAHTYLLSNYENCQYSEYCRSAYDNITMELVRALNFYRFSNPDSNLEDVYLAGGGLQNTSLLETIQQSIDLNVHPAEELLQSSMNNEGYSPYVQAIGITQDRTELVAKSRGRIPTKREINLADVGETKLDLRTAIIAIILIIAGATVFSIFGVAGRFAKLVSAQSAAAQAERELADAYEILAGYDLTQDEYAHYTFENMTPEELAQVEREDVLRLLDERVIGKCEVEYWSVSENVLTLRIVGITLEQVNRIIQDINEDELVSYSTLTTAVKEDKTEEGSISTVTASIEVILNGRVVPEVEMEMETEAE